MSVSNIQSSRLAEALRKYWGYDSFRPLQQQAMQSVVDGRDSVVVLPTGGGKSLCFQAPAVCMEGLAVIVSPLISLMKDQVDALRTCGVPAACVNSTVSYGEKRDLAEEIRGGRLRLLYMAPERLVTDRTLSFLKSVGVSFIAIDEAHCISEWGHDFRPEYRELKMLKEAFPNVGIHAYTATATERVRGDIARNLGLDDPEILVGSFDRPNLMYRVERRHNAIGQIREVLDRHKGESGIIYCIRRKDVDETCAALSAEGYRALPYHAGMGEADRRRNQEAFIEEKCDTIVATIAFGMGIDKSNVRYVVHAGMPKSLENYQQETGRAGRDGLEAECCLFYAPGDFMGWKKRLDETEPVLREGALQSLRAMNEFAAGVVCRHKVLVNHFGQQYDTPACKACDVCLGDLDLVDDALTIGQKILSCVVRLNQGFGGEYTAMVLSGSEDQKILQRRHNELSTWGILSDENRRNIRDWIEQLAGQGYLARAGEFNVLQVTDEGWRLLRGEITPRLLKPKHTTKKDREKRAASGVAADSWEGVDRGLFDLLRELRSEKAEAQGMPAYIVFGDASLRDMARRRPSTLEAFLEVRGVGEKKLEDYGREFVSRIVDYCREHQLATDVRPEQSPTSPGRERREPKGPSASELQAFALFAEGRSIADVAETMQRARSTTLGYLTQYIRHRQVTDPSPWVDAATVEKVENAIGHVSLRALQPIYEFLGETVSYEQIRIVTACLQNRTADSG